MNINRTNWLFAGCIALIVCGYFAYNGSSHHNQRNEAAKTFDSYRSKGTVVTASNHAPVTTDGPAFTNQSNGISPLVHHAVFHDSGNFQNNGEVIRDSKIRLCQGYIPCNTCGTETGCGCGGGNGGVVDGGHQGFATQAGYTSNSRNQLPSPVKYFAGVDENTQRDNTGEPRWKNADMIPWEAFAYGEYIGPHRNPHVAEYRLRVNDALEFVYILTRERSTEPYRFYVGDTISITSAIDESIDQELISVLGDGTISLSLIGQVRVAGKTIRDLQRELNDRYAKYFQNPSVVVQVLEGDTPLRDLLDSVDARAGQGGQSRNAIVSPDGTIQLPLVGSVPAIGLTLKEIAREVNARYRNRVRGIEVTPVLTERAPRFIYVVGEVAQPGRFELTGPTSSMQAIALAGGFNSGGNLRQIIVFRRDQNYKLMATKLDLAGALFGRRPHPSDEIWLRDSDIILIPKQPIQRLSEQVNRYLVQTLYAIFPQQGVAFNFDDFTSL